MPIPLLPLFSTVRSPTASQDHPGVPDRGGDHRQAGAQGEGRWWEEVDEGERWDDGHASVKVVDAALWQEI